MGADADKMVGYMVGMCENPLSIASSYLFILLAKKKKARSGRANNEDGGYWRFEQR